MQGSAQIICVYLDEFSVGEHFQNEFPRTPEVTFPGPPRPFPPPLEGKLLWGGGICGIRALSPSIPCSQWPRAWPSLCWMDPRHGKALAICAWQMHV